MARSAYLVLFGVILLSSTVLAEDAITPGKLVIDPPTLICLGFYWPVEGDDNRNAVCETRFRKEGDTGMAQGA